MQTIMMGLKAVPGVMGGMLSDEHGNVLAHSFPSFFDLSTLKGAADLIADNSIGLQEAAGEVKLFDIRTELGRIIVKTFSQMFVSVLCEPTVNIQLLFISLNVAIKKLEKLSPEQFKLLAAKPQEPASVHRSTIDKPAENPASPAVVSEKHALEKLQGWMESKFTR